MKSDDYLLTKAMPIIDQHGHMVQGVGGSKNELPFAYTVGLSAHGRPEFIIFGLDVRVSQHILNKLAERVKSTTLLHGNVIKDVVTVPIILIEAEDTSHLRVARSLYSFVRALQVVFPDGQGHFPWEEGFDLGLPDHVALPLLGPSPKE